MKIALVDFQLEIINLVNKKIETLLPVDSDKLSMAMRYGALSVGKRLRPFILISVADMFNIDRENSLRAAAAVEMIHSYSLIHDDLPAMDDDDFRRGLPSCHKKFDEATAILAGDALLTYAFEILSDPLTHSDANVRCNLIKILAENIGSKGIAGGQILDLDYEKKNLATYDQLLNMHWMKTASLFIASCLIGAKLGGVDKISTNHLMKYGEYFGLAFQFIDDLADLKEEKPLSNNNIVKLIGENKAKVEIRELLQNAKDELLIFNDKSLYLNELADQLLEELEL
jgi:farnesyl diphosphate synthase